MTLTLFLEHLKTPIGQMLLLTDEQGRLRVIDWVDHEQRMHELMRRQYPGATLKLLEAPQVSEAAQAVHAYFEGQLDALDTLETATGGTEFQRQVWAALRDIPIGETISYLELATRIGRPAAVRAVGLANGANPISVVVPCHRVIGRNAQLTGYGGGLPRKRWLLEHEKAIPIQTVATLAQGSLPGL